MFIFISDKKLHIFSDMTPVRKLNIFLSGFFSDFLFPREPTHFLFVNIYSFLCLFVYFAVPNFSCSMHNLVLWPGIEPVPPALETWSLRHWTISESL